MTILLYTRDGRQIEAGVRRPTPRLLAEVEPVYAEFERELAERLGEFAELLEPEDIEFLLAASSELTKPDVALRYYKTLKRVADTPLLRWLPYYLRVVPLVVELPADADIDWHEQDIRELHAAFSTFRRFVGAGARQGGPAAG